MFYCSFVNIHYIICECGDTFPTEEELKEHLEIEHVITQNEDFEVLEYKCGTCEKVFGTEKACLIHQRTHIRHSRRKEFDENGESVPAPQIGRHLRKNIVCEVCGKVYASNAALRYHQRVHTGERPYHCSLCPKSFTMPLFLQIHIRTHTGEKPYSCPHCPKAFSNKAALLRHDRVHTGIKPYACPKCGKSFTQSNSMKLHVRTVHLKMPAPYKSKTRRGKDAARQAAAAVVNSMKMQLRVEDGAHQVKTEPRGQEYAVEYSEEYQDQEEMYGEEDVHAGVDVKAEPGAGDVYADPDVIFEEVYVAEE